MGKIGRAIKRINYPAMAPIALLSAALFRHDSVLGEVGSQPADNRLLGAPIGLGNQIRLPLVADLCRAIELAKQDATGFCCRLHSDFQDLIAHPL